MALLKYKEDEDFTFELCNKDFVTIMGKGNKRIVNNIYNLDKNEIIKVNYMSFKNIASFKIAKRVNVVLNENLNVFVYSRVEDEIRFVLENMGLSNIKITERVAEISYKYKIHDILQCDPTTIGSSNKVKVKILIALLTNPHVLVLDNVLENLDFNDKNFIIRVLKKYAREGNAIINFTNNIEESLYGNKIIITSKDKIIAEGKTLSILNEEKLLKRLGLGLPFNIELCKLLMDYNLLEKYYYSNKRLVSKLWK